MTEFLQLLSVVVPVCAVVVLGLTQNKKLHEIHVLVNSRLSNVIAQNAEMVTQNAAMAAKISVLEEIIKGHKNAAAGK